MAKILVLGADGMVGHMARLYLGEQGHEVRSIARSGSESWERLDVEDLDTLKQYLAGQMFEFVVNCVGVLIKESELDPVRAIRLNAMLPRFLGSISRELGFRVIHASTDCVFSGNSGPYSESSLRDADEVYGRSKALGELNNDHDVTIRTSKIGPELYHDGSGLFNWLMHQKGSIKGFSRALWGGVTTLEYAKAIHWVTQNRTVGLWHLTNSAAISKYDLLSLMAEIWKLPGLEIERDDRHASNRSLVTSRNDVTYQVPSYRTMLHELHEFMTRHEAVYREQA